MSQFNQQSDIPDNVSSAVFAECIANSKQIFQLINSILPLESCLRYQILPLDLQGDRLTVGMLEPDDRDALNFISPIATSFGYHLDFKSIDSETHQLIVSAYLKEPRSAPVGDRNQTIVDMQPESSIRDNQKTYLDIQPPSQIRDRDNQKTYLDIQPPSQTNSPHSKLDSAATLIAKPEEIAKAEEEFSANPPDKSRTLTEIPEDFDFALNLAIQTKNELEREAIVENTPELSSQKANLISREPRVSNLIPETNNVKPQNYQVDKFGTLDVTAEPVIESGDFLTTLSPQISFRELLAKVLDHDIDRLQLARYSDRGSIVCSQDGSVKSALDRIDLSLFNVLINEIKTLAKIPLTTLTKTKKIAMERFHQHQRVLFRLEFAPNEHGEEINIQILRGEGLTTYEQTQMDKMSEQALALAQKLEKTLKKMQLCFSSAHLNNLRDLQMVQQKIDTHLKLLDSK